MRVVHDTGFQLALVKDMLDASAQRREIEEKNQSSGEEEYSDPGERGPK
jgi:hypothetical protein